MGNTISRRTWLKTFAGLSATGLAHFNGLLGTAFAQSTGTAPLRLICLTQPHGNTTYWAPRSATGGPAAERGWRLDFDPDSCMGPLERHKDSMVILDGLDFTCCFGEGSTGSIGHHSALASLTGSDLRGPEDRRAKGPSIDLFVSSLLKVAPMVFTFYDGLKSWDTTGEVYPESDDMVQAYQRHFAGLSTGTPDPLAQARLRADTRLLSYLRADATRLRQRLATAERIKLDQHLETLHSLEEKLVRPAATCARPAAPTGRGDTMEMPLRHSLAMQFVSTAFACNLTRVATVHMSAGAYMPWLELGASNPPVHNDIVHAMRDDVDLSVRWVSRIHRWYAEQVASLCDQLKAIPEGAGTAYDNTIIVWTNELGNGRDHQPWNVPFVLLGGGGAWSKGRYLRYAASGGTQSNAHNRLLTSVVNQFGANRTSFGEPAYSGELVGL